MEALLYAVRFLHYGAALQLFGAAVFAAMVAPAGLRAPLQAPMRRIATMSAWLLLLSGVGWLLVEAGAIGAGAGDMLNPGVVGLVLTSTGFGHVWGPRLLLCLAILVAPAWRPARCWPVVAVLSGLALGSIGLVGHAAMAEGTAGVVARTSHVVHLLAAGFWLGALAPLVLSVRALRRDEQGPTEALRRFSGAGHVAVALLVVTGIANAWWIVGAGIDSASRYQQLLAAKLVLVVAMVGLAAIKRYRVLPRLAAGANGSRQLARSIAAEMALGAAVIALVSVFGVLPPG